MQEYKIIFAGSMGAGKTTSIRALSDVDVVRGDVDNTDTKTHGKLLTTVGIDYGQVVLGNDTKIGLYGTPGQERFELVWRIVTEGALGAIILIDGSSAKAKDELSYYVRYFNEHNMAHIVVGITHTDLPDAHLTVSQGLEILQAQNLLFPVFEIDARQREDVLLLVESLIASIEAEIN
ncbi:MAG: GTP-binding protein [Cardiobacteriaceae bacterium]|nr:GTP-binding protein [Cardiobacteriaceae bacterium]